MGQFQNRNLLSNFLFLFVLIFVIILFDKAHGQKEDSSVDFTIEQSIYTADDFDILEGLEIVTRSPYSHERFLQLKNDAESGCAQRIFFSESARYDISLFCLCDFGAKLLVRVLINGTERGAMKFDIPDSVGNKSPSVIEKSLSGINIQRYSRITLEIMGDRGKKCRVERLIFTPVGPFSGKFVKIKVPETLRFFESIQEQQNARGMLSRFVNDNLNKLFEKRKAELTSLKTSAEWKEKQRKTRMRLSEFFGKFPPKTPLNARIVGKLEREKYIIEKIIFESQPNYYCTANFYIPKRQEFPLPGVLFTCGHSKDAKAYRLYHEGALGLVLKGYVVLVLDPMGQGERSEYFDPKTKEPLVELCVPQHHYIGRPAFLVDWSLSGLRTWDCIRAVDYLVSRPEVDRSKLAVMGNSGGGQMALLTTAVDERISVCAAGHPGGSMENTYLLGQRFIDRQVLSLIPPRPCRIIVGKDSGEEPRHRQKLEDMQLFYEGLAVGKRCGDIEVVHGVHDLKQPKRESAYEWLNKWLGKEVEGKAEQPLQTENVETLWCTESGITLLSLGGESGKTLNAKRAEQIYNPERNITRLKVRIAERVHFEMPQNHNAILWKWGGTLTSDNFSAEKFLYESEKGIEVPSLLLRPKNPKFNELVIIHASDKGKPTKINTSSIPVEMVQKGYTILSIDVRGIGETDPSPPVTLTKYTGYISPQWRRDCLAINSVGFKRTMLGMRALDIIHAIDFIKTRDDLKDKKIALVGEGLDGLWMLLAGAYDTRSETIVCIGTLPSYKLLINNKYYNVWGYFWLPGALRDFDIPDLVRLNIPRRQLWIDTINQMAERLGKEKTYSLLGDYDGFSIVRTEKGSIEEVSEAIAEFLK